MNNVKQWPESEIGDAVLVLNGEDTRTLFIHAMEGARRCDKCYYGMNLLRCPDSVEYPPVALRETHNSCCQVYFVSGAGNIIPKDDGVGNDV